MDGLVAELARCRRELRLAIDAYSHLLEEFEGRQDVIEASRRVEAARLAVAEAERRLRSAAIRTYTKTLRKTIHPAVRIQVYTRFFYREKEAVQWCMENLPRALMVRAPFFEDYLRHVQKVSPLPFVTVREEPVVVIAHDLSPWEGEEHSEKEG